MPDDLSITRVSGANQPDVADPSATVAGGVDPLSILRRASGDGLPSVPGYEVTREIARGGMGRVLAARDLKLKRPVAIKVLLPRAGRDGARRFVTEAEITAQLQHPNIPPVHELGTLGDGSPFLAMKLIEGSTLTVRLRDRTAPTDDLPVLIQVFERVCEAVGFAHSQNIVHRDLKPANMMVGAFGEVQVMDWGLAKSALGAPEPESKAPAHETRVSESAAGDTARTSDSPGASTEETAAGQVLGTPSYMSPEQARGEQVDVRADVFSLGAILCEILTGARPFAGRASTEVVGHTAAGALDEPLAKLDASGAPAGLIALAKQCLAPVPADRPADGKAVADAVAAYRTGVETRLRAAEAERAAAETRAVEQRKRRRVQLALVGTVALLVLGAGAGGWWLDHKATAQRAENERRERERAERERVQREKDERAADDNRRALADEVARCETALRADGAPAAAHALADIARREGQPGGAEFAARIAHCREDLALLTRLDDVETFAWTPVRGEPPSLAAVQAKWAAALAAAGIAPGTAPATETARRVNESLIRDRLLLTLDLWHGAPGAPDLTGVLHTADPDPTRDAARAAVQAHDGARLAELTAEGLRDQPSRFVVALATPFRPALPPERLRALLTAEWTRAPDNFRVLMELGGTYPVNRKEGAAERVRWFQAAVALRPRSATPWLMLAAALRDDGRPGPALAAIHEAQRLDPTNPGVHAALGDVLWERKDLDGAVRAYRDAIRCAPPDPRLHNNLGILLRQTNDLKGAIAEYKEALRLDPKHTRARYNLGLALRAAGDPAGAVKAYQELLAVIPTHAPGHNGLGNALWDLGDLGGAINEFREALRNDPNNRPAQLNLAEALKAWDRIAPPPREVKRP